jgi:excisionase family DNA binding protein
MRKVFTTGQVAKICSAAPRTVSKWFDSGRLKGYRIPGSQDRRIPREQLIRFLKEHGMPLGELEEEQWHKILLIGTEKLFNDRLKELLPKEDDYKFEQANSGFEAGILVGSSHPDTIIIDRLTPADADRLPCAGTRSPSASRTRPAALLAGRARDTRPGACRGRRADGDPACR